MRTVYILIASHNRKNKTLRCLESIAKQELVGYKLEIILFDDGSFDSTVQEVRRCYPEIEILEGDGSNFWCRSMCEAYDCIREQIYENDFVLCLNDDVILYDGALRSLIAQFETLPLSSLSVIAGTLEDDKYKVTYGGLKRIGKIKYKLVTGRAELCDTLNFNVVLLPSDLVKQHGFLDRKFEHSMADIEYGIRLTFNNVKIYTSYSVIGLCESNNLFESFGRLPLKDRIALCLSKKYFPINSWKHFTKKTCGIAWPLYFVYPYIKFGILGIK